MARCHIRVRGRQILRYIAALLVILIGVSLALTIPLRWQDPPTTAFILQEQFRNKSTIRLSWVPFSEISPELPIAVVAAEDQKFPHHYGFDFQSLAEALREDRQRPRGASTITQQLAKNLYLWPGRSLFRKALEAWFAVLIELTWPKQRILEVYLNVVEFGPAIYGADTASRLFFGKPPGKITAREAATLAAVLPDPKRMSAAWPSEYVQKRASEIEAEVISLGGPGYLARL